MFVCMCLHTCVSPSCTCSYNHYAGRLGIPMPETAKLLAAHPVEFFSFHCEWQTHVSIAEGPGGGEGGILCLSIGCRQAVSDGQLPM
jgi:hypothetical protein